jgi:dihydrofolate synthase/folylpolyglutamate synthase
MNTQTAWLDWLEQRCAHQPIQMGLPRVRQVAACLDVLRFDVPVITVGGTNGKGSTVRSLEAIYHAAGHVVAAYTSPHLLTFNERICINLHPIDEQALCEAFHAVYAAEQISQLVLTYFEFTTLAALWHFKRIQAQIIILEVGLGGRLDATNVIDADVAILTTIDFDHQAFLGDTLEDIGFEKAGIFRPRQQAIFAAAHPPQSVLKVASQLHTQLKCYQRDYTDEVTDTYQFKSPEFEWTAARPKLHPQAISAAIMATRLLHARLPIPLQAYDALTTAQLAGRLQLITGPIDMVFDVSHNLQSVGRLSTYLASTFPTRKIHAIFSALDDKPAAAMLACLAHQVTCWHIAPLSGKRAMTMAQLQQACPSSPRQLILWYNDLNLAYDGAKALVCTGDVIIVFGSFLTVAAILSLHQGDTL